MKKIFLYTFRKLTFCLFLMCSAIAVAQNDSLIKRTPTDTLKQKLNMDAIYNRPFLTVGKLPVALGGYLEANTQYSGTDGVSDGFSFQMRRMTLFVSSTIAKKIKFLSELEFEEGTKEINLRILRHGSGNASLAEFKRRNHHESYWRIQSESRLGPRWDFIDRPISATGIIPSTLSNVGMGFFTENTSAIIGSWVMKLM